MMDRLHLEQHRLELSRSELKVSTEVVRLKEEPDVFYNGKIRGQELQNCKVFYGIKYLKKE
jgi:hypothetical protein